MIVEGVGTRFNFPDYIARRPALALRACGMVLEMLQHCENEGAEPPWGVPPISVMMWIEMAGVLHELSPDGMVFRLNVPQEVRRWI